MQMTFGNIYVLHVQLWNVSIYEYPVEVMAVAIQKNSNQRPVYVMKTVRKN